MVTEADVPLIKYSPDIDQFTDSILAKETSKQTFILHPLSERATKDNHFIPHSSFLLLILFPISRGLLIVVVLNTKLYALCIIHSTFFFFFAKSACLPGICQILYFTETSTAQSSLVLDLTALRCCNCFLGQSLRSNLCSFLFKSHCQVWRIQFCNYSRMKTSLESQFYSRNLVFHFKSFSF